MRKHCRKQHAKWLSRVDARYAGGALASDAFQRRAETYSRRMVIEVDAEGPAKQRRLSQASPDELDGFCRCDEADLDDEMDMWAPSGLELEHHSPAHFPSDVLPACHLLTPPLSPEAPMTPMKRGTSFADEARFWTERMPPIKRGASLADAPSFDPLLPHRTGVDEARGDSPDGVKTAAGNVDDQATAQMDQFLEVIWA